MPDILTSMRKTLIRRSSIAIEILIDAGQQFWIDRASRMGAAIAYRTVFALAPLLIIAVAVLGVIVGSDEAFQEFIDGVEQIFGSDFAGIVKDFLNSVQTSTGSAVTLGVILLFWTSSSLFLELQHDLNDIFGVPYEHMTGVFALARKRGIGVLWTMGLGVAMIAVWSLNVVWQFFEGLFANPVVHQVLGWLTPLFSVILLPLLFALIFQTLTIFRIRWRAVLWGGLFTAVVFLITAYGVGLYFSWDRNTTALAVASSFFVVLFVAYLLANVFFFGAEVTKVFHDYMETGEIKPVKQSVASGDILVAEPPEPVPVAAVAGFLSGLFVAWRRTRR